MSKSMLVIDTPDNCVCCKLCNTEIQHCNAIDRCIGAWFCLNKKPIFCPLKEVSSIKRYDLNDDHWACYQKGSATMDEYEEGDWVKYTDIVGE